MSKEEIMQRRIDTLVAENKELRSALKEVASTLGWIAHGECRLSKGEIMTSSQAMKLAKSLLGEGPWT